MVKDERVQTKMLTFRMTSSGLISLPRDRNGSFISQINYDYQVFSKEI